MIKLTRFTLLYLWVVGSLSASAAIYYWDPQHTLQAGFGSGNWDPTSTVWADSLATPGNNVAWVNGNDAVFGGAPGNTDTMTVTLNTPITVGNLSFTTYRYVLNTTDGNPLTITNGITANIASARLVSTIAGTGGLIMNGNQTVDASSGVNIKAVLSGSGVITKTGSGAIGLSGNNTYTGKFVVNAGMLGITSDAALGAVPTSFQADNITLNGGTLVAGGVFSGPANFDNPGANITLDANRGITLGANGGTIRVGYGPTLTVTVNGIISGVGALTKSDSGILVLNGINTYTGKTLINGNGTLLLNGSIASTSSIEINNGTLQLGVGGTFGHLPITFTGATSYLKFSRTDDFTYSDELIATGAGIATIGSNAGQTVTVTSNIHGNGGFGSTGLGTVILAVDTTYTGGTNVGGILQVGTGGTVGNIGAGTITFANSGENYLKINRSDDLVLANAVAISGGRGHLGTTTGRTLTLTGALSGTGELWIDGPGTIVINKNASTNRTGVTVVAGGILQLSDLSALGTGNLTIGQASTTSAGAGVVYAGDSVVATNFRTLSTAYGFINVTKAGTTLSLDSSFGAPGVGAGIPAYLVTKLGAGTLSFEGVNDNTRMRVRVEDGTVLLGKNTNAGAHSLGGDNSLILNNGTVRITGNNGDQIYDPSSIQVNGGVFDLNGASEAVNILYSNSAGGVVTNNQAGPVSTLTLGGSNGSGVYTGKLQDGLGQLALVKNGTGSLTLTGANLVGGGTKVNNGRLIVAGSLTGGLTEVTGDTDTGGKYTGGVLGGTGRVGNVLTHKGFISPGATVAGATIGTLTTGSVDMSGIGTLEIAIDTSTLESSLLQVEGDLTLGFSEAVLALTDLGAAAPMAKGTTLTILSYTGSWDGGTFLFGKLGSIEDDTSFTFGLNTYTIDYDHHLDPLDPSSLNEVTLTVLSSVPEPATGGLFAGGLALLGSWRRRRKVAHLNTGSTSFLS